MPAACHLQEADVRVPMTIPDIVQRVGIVSVTVGQRLALSRAHRDGTFDHPAGHRDVDAVTAQFVNKPERHLARVPLSGERTEESTEFR
jgi:hypothetical protein